MKDMKLKEKEETKIDTDTKGLLNKNKDLDIYSISKILQNIKEEFNKLEWNFGRYGLWTLNRIAKYSNSVGIYKFLEYNNGLNFSMLNNVDTKFIAYEECSNIPDDFNVWIAKNIDILKINVEEYKRRKRRPY